MDFNVDKFKDIIISSRIRLARNFTNIAFPVKLTDKDAQILIAKVDALAATLDDFNLFYIKDLSDDEKNLLKEKHLISPNLIKNNKTGAVLLNKDETISIMINEEDHLREQCIMPGFNLNSAYAKINEVDNIILQNEKIAFSENWGFLTACPSNVGTGMRASVMLFLPGLTLINKIEDIIKHAQKLGQTVRGVYGEGSMAEGYMYQISNQISLGLTEQELIDNVNKIVLRVCDLELLARKELLIANPEKVQNLIVDAFKTIKNSLFIDYNEMIDLISKLKLGQSLKIIEFDDPDMLDYLMDALSTASIISMHKTKISKIDENIFRANYLKNSFEKYIM